MPSTKKSSLCLLSLPSKRFCPLLMLVTLSWRNVRLINWRRCYASLEELLRVVSRRRSIVQSLRIFGAWCPANRQSSIYIRTARRSYMLSRNGERTLGNCLALMREKMLTHRASVRDERGSVSTIPTRYQLGLPFTAIPSYGHQCKVHREREAQT